MTNPALFAPLQDLPQVLCLFPALAWLFGKSQAASHGDKSAFLPSTNSLDSDIFWFPAKVLKAQYSSNTMNHISTRALRVLISL